MKKPQFVSEITLLPGGVCFGDRTNRISTVLGSCVSLVFWHPHELIGGMCHFMLPLRGIRSRDSLDGRYADEAVEMAIEEMRKRNTHAKEYKVKMFGGGNMFPWMARDYESNIGLKNISAARELMKQHGLICSSEHVGGSGFRKLTFDTWSGEVSLKHCSINQNDKSVIDSISLLHSSISNCEKNKNSKKPMDPDVGEV